MQSPGGVQRGAGVRTSFDMAMAQSDYRVKCSVCGEQVYDSLAQRCPINGTVRCMYCCRRICAALKPVFNGWQCTGETGDNRPADG